MIVRQPVKLTQDEDRILQVIVQERGMSFSAVLRLAINSVVKQEAERMAISASDNGKIARYLLLLVKSDDNVPVAWCRLFEYWEARTSLLWFVDRLRLPDRELLRTLPKAEPDVERMMLAESNGYRLWYVRNVSD